MSELHSQLMLTFNSPLLVYSPKQKLNKRFLRILIDALDKNRQTLIIDPKRVWNPTETEYIKIIRPHSIDNLIQSIVDIPNYLTNRIGLLVFLDFFYYLRDFKGRRVIDTAINTRSISFINAILKQIKMDNLLIVVEGYQDSIRPNQALGENYFKYYDYSVVKLNELGPRIVLESDTASYDLNT